MSIVLSLALASSLPSDEQCKAVVNNPAAALSHNVALQAYIYGYPIVDLAKQKHNETHRVRDDQPVATAVNQMAVYPHLLTPRTQGQLRAANADTLYLNAWLDLSDGPALFDVPQMGERYYTFTLFDQYGKPQHIGTRFNNGKAKRYALVGPSGGNVPADAEPYSIPTDIVWMLGRIMVDGPSDVSEAKRLAGKFLLSGKLGETVSKSDQSNPAQSLEYFVVLNAALKTLPAIAGEESLMAAFDSAGFGPTAAFDPDKLSEAERLGMECALVIGPKILKERGFRPTQLANGWMLSSSIANPGRNYLLRAAAASGGYVNEPEESIYPAAITDNQGEFLNGKHRYRLTFESGNFPPVEAFWSITAYDRQTSQLIENPIRRYQFGDRTKGAKQSSDGSLSIILSHEQPPEGISNWLPVPANAFLLVGRLYLPKAEALDGRYVLPAIERLEPLVGDD